MEREFVILPEFDRQWTKLGLDDDDLARLQNQIKKYPQLGAVIRGTGGVRKLRFAFENRGKSGSTRVLYVDLVISDMVMLLTAYAKSAKNSLTDAEKNEIKALVSLLKQQYEK
jgi:hypothetical protein